MGDMADWAEMQAFEQMFEDEYNQEEQKIRSEEIKRLYATRRLKWQTSAGEVIIVQDLETGHLKNCISFLKENNEADYQLTRATTIEIFEYELSKR